MKHTRLKIIIAVIILVVISLTSVLVWFAIDQNKTKYSPNSRVNSQTFLEYVDYSNHSLLVVCYPDTSNAPEIFARTLPSLKERGFNSIYIDLPYQGQAFIDGYISGEASWEIALQSYKVGLSPYSDSSKLESFRSLIDTADESNYTMIMMNTLFIGENSFLTYPDIPAEHDLDKFMYEYWSRNHRENAKEIIMLSYEHCVSKPASVFGEFFVVGEAGGFNSISNTSNTLGDSSTVDTVADQKLYIKNKGYGNSSVVESLSAHKTFGMILFEFDQSKANTYPAITLSQDELLSHPFIIYESSDYQQLP